MKRIYVSILLVLCLFIGVNSVSATCYYRTITITTYTSNFNQVNQNSKKVNSKNCNGIKTCFKNVEKKEEYVANCPVGSKNVKVSCKKVSPKKCKGKVSGFNKIWNEKYGFLSVDGLAYVSCGKDIKSCPKEGAINGSAAYDIPVAIPDLISYAVTALKIATPIILIIMGMIQLVKGIISQSEDEIKKSQSGLIKKFMAAGMIFFMVTIVQFVINLVSDSTEKNSFASCLSCFLNGTTKCNSVYYREKNKTCKNIKEFVNDSETIETSVSCDNPTDELVTINGKKFCSRKTSSSYLGCKSDDYIVDAQSQKCVKIRNNDCTEKYNPHLRQLEYTCPFDTSIFTAEESKYSYGATDAKKDCYNSCYEVLDKEEPITEYLNSYSLANGNCPKNYEFDGSECKYVTSSTKGKYTSKYNSALEDAKKEETLTKKQQSYLGSTRSTGGHF